MVYMMDALKLEVKKDGFAQLQTGNYKLTVTLNPTDLDDNTQSLLLDFIKAPMGTIYMLGMGRVGDDGEPAKTTPAPSETPGKPKKRFHELPLSQQAALRCGDQNFRAFLHIDGWETYDAESAAEVVRSICNVDSRAELSTDAFAGQQWTNLNSKFEAWAGLATVQH